MKAALAALLLLVAPAFAEEVPPASNGDLPDTACPYPDPALLIQAQGTTTISFVGTAKGNLTALKVVSSSGNDDLDKAAVNCISHWHFDPKTPLGKMQIGSHRIAMAWQLLTEPGTQTAGRRTGIPHNCLSFYPSEAQAIRAIGTTTVRFTITEDGAVKSPNVQVSSGNAALDQAALACVLQWRYRPAIKNGKPAAVPWRAKVNWTPAVTMAVPDGAGSDPKPAAAAPTMDSDPTP